MRHRDGERDRRETSREKIRRERLEAERPDTVGLASKSDVRPPVRDIRRRGSEERQRRPGEERRRSIEARETRPIRRSPPPRPRPRLR